MAAAATGSPTAAPTSYHLQHHPFGEDEQGQLYLADYTAGKIYQIQYTEASRTISGNAGASNVTLSYTDGTAKTVTSAADGLYAFTIPNNWNGTLTPTSPCYTFNPPALSLNNVVTNLSNQNFTATFNNAPGCANINITIVGQSMVGNPFAVAPGASTRQSFPSINNGPVQIASTNAVQILGAERVIYKVDGVTTSFSEMMALPNSQLSTTYWLPYYNNVDLNTQPPADALPAQELRHGLHGGVLETSMMLHLAPAKVRSDALANWSSLGCTLADHDMRLGPEGEAGFAWLAEDLNPAGVTGNALLANAALGARLVEHFAAVLAELILVTARFDLAWLDSRPQTDQARQP